MFRISRFFIDQNWASLMAVFKHVVIVRCELFHAGDYFEYVAYSNHFDEIPAGFRIPLYDVVARTKPDQSVSVTFSKQKDYINGGYTGPSDGSIDALVNLDFSLPVGAVERHDAREKLAKLNALRS